MNGRPQPASITCPVCGRTSWHPADVVEGWCGACHGATSLPPPPGFRWVLFETAEPRDRFGRLLEERQLEVGASYEILVGDTAGEYVYRDDGTFAQKEGTCRSTRRST